MNTRNIVFPSNNFCDVEAVYHQRLDTIYEPREVKTFLMMLAEKYLGWDTTAYLLHRHEHINQSVLLDFHWALKDLERQRPVQHIIGATTFCGITLEVSPAVLIPRPETEEMTLRLIQYLRDTSFSPASVLDLCTGSGCIAIAMKKAFPKAIVVGADISAEALAVARRNAVNNAADVTFLQADILNRFDWDRFTHLGSQGGPEVETYNIIISNPPYVRDSERKEMHSNVLDYEPSIALFVDDSAPLVFYQHIAEFALQRLTPEGMLAIEINEHLGNETCSLLSSHSLCTTLHKDFAGKDRYIFCNRSPLSV